MSGGRPRHGVHLKSAPVGIRTDPALRQMLEDAAAYNGVSLTCEVERRLKASFETTKESNPMTMREKIIAALDKADVHSVGWRERAAEAVLQAMREPTAEMLQPNFGPTTTEISLRIWQAMIDSALKE